MYIWLDMGERQWKLSSMEAMFLPSLKIWPDSGLRSTVYKWPKESTCYMLLTQLCSTSPNLKSQVGNNLISNHIRNASRSHVLSITKSYAWQLVWKSYPNQMVSWDRDCQPIIYLLSHWYYICHAFKMILSSSCSQSIRRSSLTKRVP